MGVFLAPKIIRYGAGTRQELPEQLRDWAVRRPLIVTDPWMRDSGQVPVVPGGKVFADVQPDPTDQNVAEGLRQFQEHEADGIVAFGGGSPIDCAKAIRYTAARRVPLIAMPTTAGTGSEATPVIVITDTVNHVKKMTRAPELMCDAAIVDYELTLTMPRALTAHVGVDTLTHGIEAYVSRKATPLTSALARSCIELTQRHLRAAWTNGADREAREGMSLAALEGGMAFGNASVALVHGMSRPLGAVFHLPHGLSNAVLLAEVTRYSWRGHEQAYVEIAAMMGVPGERDSFIEALEQLNRDLEVPRLRECCGRDEARFSAALQKMAVDALASGSPANNPVVPSAEEIMEIYRQAW